MKKQSFILSLVLSFVIVILVNFCACSEESTTYKFTIHPSDNNLYEVLTIKNSASYIENDIIYVMSESCDVETTDYVAEVKIYPMIDNVKMADQMMYIGSMSDTSKYILKTGTYEVEMNFGGLIKVITIIVGNEKSETEYSFKTDSIYNNSTDTYYGQVKCYLGGTNVWTYNTESYPVSDSASTTEARIYNNIVYFASVNKLFALDITTGGLLWQVDNIAGGTDIIFDKTGNVYVSGHWGQVYTVVNKNGVILDRIEYSGWVNSIRIYYDTLYADCYYIDNYDNEKEEKIQYDISKYYHQADKKPEYINVKKIIVQVGNPFMKVNGVAKPIDENTGTVPYIINGRTLVPIRAIVEEMGGTVDWDSHNNMAVLIFRGNTIKLILNSTTAYLNDISQILDVAPIEINGRTMLPVRFIAESFGFDVKWNGLTEEIRISEQEENNEKVNIELLECIGRTKKEISDMYGKITDSEYIDGGKYYIHNNLKSEFFYENKTGVYDYNIHDDVSENSNCNHIIANISELMNTPYKTVYTIEELKDILGTYDFIDDLSNDFYSLCFYKFTYGNYIIIVRSDYINPKVEYVWVSYK